MESSTHNTQLDTAVLNPINTRMFWCLCPALFTSELCDFLCEATKIHHDHYVSVINTDTSAK